MQVELLENRLDHLRLAEEDRKILKESLERLKGHHYRLINLLMAAEEDLSSEEEGPWSLKEFLEKEIAFWEADLAFKHRVKKVLNLEDLHLYFPRRRLRAGLCALLGALVPALGEKEGELEAELRARREGAELCLRWRPMELSPEADRLAAAREILSPEAEVSLGPGEIHVIFSHGTS